MEAGDATMTRNNTGTNTRQTTETHSKVLVQNQITDLYSLIGLEGGADINFLQNNRRQIERILEMGLEQERLDEVRYVIVDSNDRVVDEWVLDLSYGRGKYELTTPSREAVQREADSLGPGEHQALILPIIDGENIFDAPDIDGISVDSFGGPGVDVDINHRR